MKITMGPSLQEYQDLAKKSHMDDLHLEILKLRDRVGAIQRTQDYAKVRTSFVYVWRALLCLWLTFEVAEELTNADLLLT
jgi:hypothetical protein